MANHIHEELNTARRALASNTLGPDTLQDFLKSGWLLSLPSSPHSLLAAPGSQQILVGWGDSSVSAHPSSRSGEASLFAPNFYPGAEPDCARPWRLTPFWDLLDRDVFASLVMSGVARNVNAEDQGFQWVEPRFETFRDRFDAVQQKMRDGLLQKAVPVVFAEAQGNVNEARKLKILRNLAALPSNLFIYGVWGQEGGHEFGMLGATPEILFSEVAPGQVETVALAGTRGKSQDPGAGDSLLSDPKERAEHQFVIDDIRSVLEKIGSVEIGPTGVVELPTLYHLKTPIRARLGTDLQVDQMARILHPTPALGLAPRRLGFDEMRTWDDDSVRWRFGAPFGVSLDWVARDGSRKRIRDCVVAIRNIQWQDQHIRLGSGCGVVPASDLHREWDELRLKRESVKRMLGV